MVKVVLAVSAFLQLAGFILLLAGAAEILQRAGVLLDRFAPVPKIIEMALSILLGLGVIGSYLVMTIAAIKTAIYLAEIAGAPPLFALALGLGGGYGANWLFWNRVVKWMYKTGWLRVTMNEQEQHFATTARSVYNALKGRARFLGDQTRLAIIGAFITFFGILGQFIGSTLDIFQK